MVPRAMTSFSGVTRRVRRRGAQLTAFVLNRDGRRTRRIRGLVFDAAGRFGLTSTLSVDTGGARYIVSTADRGVGRETFTRGSYEEDLIASAIGIAEELVGRRPLLAGRTFVDIGAHVGTTVIPALLRFGAADGIAFEPVPPTFDLLRRNVNLNGLIERITTMPLALSDREGTLTMELCPWNWGDHRIRTEAHRDVSALLGEAGWQTVEVRSACFDTVAAETGIEVDRIGLVWIDAQGHEPFVLRGASTILRSPVPVVIEYWPYGLRRSGGLDLLHDLIRAHYDVAVDARSLSRVAAADVAVLASKYPGPFDYTDLVLAKSPR